MSYKINAMEPLDIEFAVSGTCSEHVTATFGLKFH